MGWRVRTLARELEMSPQELLGKNGAREVTPAITDYLLTKLQRWPRMPRELPSQLGSLIAQGKRCPSLLLANTLCLDHQKLRGSGVRDLSRNSDIENLTFQSLRHNIMGTTGCQHLATSPHLTPPHGVIDDR